VTFYIGLHYSESHPLGFQAKWLSVNSGGKIPDEFMNSVENIKKIADKNKVSFEDLLCHLIEEIEAEEKLKTESQKNDEDQ
jgi:hypothetical protein